MIRKCSSSEDDGSERNSWTVSDCKTNVKHARSDRMTHGYLTYLTPYVVEQPGEDVFCDGENVRGMSLVHPVPYDSLEWCLYLLLLVLQQGHWHVARVIVVAWGTA